MKKDYLWDKTGEDPEIERFEKALRAFAYRENAPPALPAKILPFKEKPVRRIFPFAMAAAACIAFVAIGLGFWLRISGKDAEVKTASVKPAEIQNAAELPFVQSDIKADVLIAKVPEKIKLSNERQVTKTSKIAFIKIPQKKAETQSIKIQQSNPVLTKQEQYAYDQLMLALSITSSKLKLVKDKVEGADEKTTERQTVR